MSSSAAVVSPPDAQRSPHRRNKSSRSAMLKALVSSSRAQPEAAEPRASISMARSQTVPLLPPDHPHATQARVLGERQSNMQSPPSSPAKRKESSKNTAASSGVKGTTHKKPKSSAGLATVLSKMNRSNKDLTALPQLKDKENTSPPSTSNGTDQTPSWSRSKSDISDSVSGALKSSVDDEIARYMPVDYSPSKQRNFCGTSDNPVLRPSLARRPQSEVFTAPEGFVGFIGRQVSGGSRDRDAKASLDFSSRSSRAQSVRGSSEREGRSQRGVNADRKVSGSSAEGPLPKPGLSIAKRSGRVMAAVAALQGRMNKPEPTEQTSPLDPKLVDAEFEAVLDARNVPQPMREKMRSLTLRVKADFVRQEKGATKGGSAGPSPIEPTSKECLSRDECAVRDDDDGATKRPRPRSRTFTFSKSEKRSTATPSKKQRSQSKSRPTSIHVPKDAPAADPSTPSTPKSASGRRTHKHEVPADYITYLKDNHDPTKMEVGRMHKLRILLRNETVAWVDSFVALGGMSDIVGLLHKIMAIEWREEHEDQLLHEALLCLKGLCTTAGAQSELETFADTLFPPLLAMLFDDEKKGPAEYTTRTVIINILFTYVSAAAGLPPIDLEQRVRKTLAYLGEPAKPDDARPLDFVLGMHAPRPYKLWCREMTNVTREVFWIFLHHLNVVPLPKRPDGRAEPDGRPASASFTARHFPGARPPVPAAPYIGGVEWDATTYLAAHLDLLNGLIASLPSREVRNALRAELQASGFEKTMGATLRTCKEKFYSGVHDGLRAWVAAADEDAWPTEYVREGPTMEEQARSARASPKKAKKQEAPPMLEEIRLEAPKLDLKIGDWTAGRDNGDDDDGWLG